MTVDEQIRSSLAAVPLGDRPSDADRAAVEAAAGRLRQRRSRRRLAVASLAAALLVVVAIVAWPRGASELSTVANEGAPAPAGTPEGWVQVTDPTTGWTMWVPPSWHSRSDAVDQCGARRSRAVARSDAESTPWTMDSSGCSAQPDSGSADSHSVVVSIAHREGGPPTTEHPPPDTPFPLTLDPSQLEPSPYGGIEVAVLVVTFERDPNFLVDVVLGVDAPTADRNAAFLVVASIRPPGAVVDPTSTSVTQDGWTVVTDPTFGFTMEVPPGWRHRSDAHVCGASSLAVRNDGEPPRWSAPGAIDCDVGPSTSTASIVVTVAHIEGQRPDLGSHVPDADAVFPLDGAAFPVIDNRDVGVSGYGISFAVGTDDGYRFEIDVGQDASDADRADARRVVSSIRPPASDSSSADERTIDLPSVPTQGDMPEAIIGGTLVAEGDCLYVEHAGQREMVVWNGPTTMVVRGGSLVEVRRPDEVLPAGEPIERTGGHMGSDWLEAVSLPIANVRPECITPTIAFVG